MCFVKAVKRTSIRFMNLEKMGKFQSIFVLISKTMGRGVFLVIPTPGVKKINAWKMKLLWKVLLSSNSPIPPCFEFVLILYNPFLIL